MVVGADIRENRGTTLRETVLKFAVIDTNNRIILFRHNDYVWSTTSWRTNTNTSRDTNCPTDVRREDKRIQHRIVGHRIHAGTADETRFAHSTDSISVGTIILSVTAY